MTRYYFNVYNGDGLTRDEEGQELDDLEAARGVALSGVRSVLAAEVKAGRMNLDGRIEILGGGMQLVMTIRFDEAVRINPNKSAHA